jgi:DUF971 family protein
VRPTYDPCSITFWGIEKKKCDGVLVKGKRAQKIKNKCWHIESHCNYVLRIVFSQKIRHGVFSKMFYQRVVHGKIVLISVVSGSWSCQVFP